MTQPTNMALLPTWAEQLLDAGTPQELEDAVAARGAELAELFPLWSRVPAVKLGDAEATALHGERIGRLLMLLAEAGEPEPLRQVQEESVRRQDALFAMLNHAMMLQEWGFSERALKLLGPVVEGLTAIDTDPSVTVAVGQAHRARAYAWLDVHQFDRADTDARRARAAFRACSDPRHVAECTELLDIIQALHVPHADPPEGKALLECRAAVASAQQAYDDARYDESDELLDAARAIGEHSAPWYEYSLETKVFGLSGLVNWQLGRFAAAREMTTRALVWSWTLGNEVGVGVYSNNLADMSRRDTPIFDIAGEARDADPGLIIDRAGAWQWLHRSTDAGDPGCAYHLGVLTLNADPPDRKRAAELFQLAARKRHVRAAKRLGQLLVDSGNTEAARGWLETAAEAGAVAAMMQLAAILIDSSTENDAHEAIRLLERAALAGDPNAREAIRIFRSSSLGTDS